MDCPSMVDTPGGMGSRTWRPPEPVTGLDFSARRFVLGCAPLGAGSCSGEGVVLHGPAPSPLPAGVSP